MTTLITHKLAYRDRENALLAARCLMGSHLLDSQWFFRFYFLMNVCLYFFNDSMIFFVIDFLMNFCQFSMLQWFIYCSFLDECVFYSFIIFITDFLTNIVIVFYSSIFSLSIPWWMSFIMISMVQWFFSYWFLLCFLWFDVLLMNVWHLFYGSILSVIATYMVQWFLLMISWRLTESSMVQWFFVTDFLKNDCLCVVYDCELNSS